MLAGERRARSKVQRKMAIVARPLRGEPLELVVCVRRITRNRQAKRVA